MDIQGMIRKPKWIFGAGKKCNDFMIFLEISKQVESILGIVDNSLELIGTEKGGKAVIGFSEFLEQYGGETVILCCSNANYEVMKQQLTEGGVTNFIYYDADLRGHIVDEICDVFGDFVSNDYRPDIVSKLCSQKDFEQNDFVRLAAELHLDIVRHQYRKTWEFVYICQALEKYNMLQPGKRGVGFAVGKEPLPCYFASKGVSILATDLGAEEEQAQNWMANNQNAGGNIDELYKSELCTRETFDRLVKYRDVDMNDIPSDIGEYDFCWSSCAIEHVGGLELSKRFLKNVLSVLKPGGISVHTTEFNLTSNHYTIEDGYCVIFRKKDVEEIKEWMHEQGHEMEVWYGRSREEGDLFVDRPPYMQTHPKYHLCLQLGIYASTSFGFIIRKAK